MKKRLLPETQSRKSEESDALSTKSALFGALDKTRVFQQFITYMVFYERYLESFLLVSYVIEKS